MLYMYLEFHIKAQVYQSIHRIPQRKQGIS